MLAKDPVHLANTLDLRSWPSWRSDWFILRTQQYSSAVFKVGNVSVSYLLGSGW